GPFCLPGGGCRGPATVRGFCRENHSFGGAFRRYSRRDGACGGRPSSRRRPNADAAGGGVRAMGVPLLLAVAAGSAVAAFGVGVLVTRRARAAGAAPPPEPARPAALANGDQPDEPTTRRVLVVDDDPGLRLLLRTTLALDELEVEEASGAVEAESLARFRRPAAAIGDVGLADGNGLVLCRRLKQMTRGDPPLVILLTGPE